jgi:transposase
MQQQVTTVGLDLAKNLFQVHGADAQGRPVLERKLARGKVREFFANLPPCLVGLEGPFPTALSPAAILGG